MDASIVSALASQAGFSEEEQSALQDKLARFAGLVLALRDENQSVQVERLLEFSQKYSLEDIRELADSGELEKLLPTLEILPEDLSPIKFSDLKPLDPRMKK